MIPLNKNTGYKTKIVTRLRLTFICLIVLLGVSALVLGYLLSNLERAQLKAFEQSVAALDHSQQLAQQLSAINDSSIKLHNEVSRERVIDLRTKTLQQVNSLRNVVTKKQLSQTSNTVTINLLYDLLMTLEELVIKSAEFKLDTIWLDVAIRMKTSQISKIRADFNNITKPMSIDIAANINSEISTISDNVYLKRPTLFANSLQQNFNNQNQLLNISYRMSSLMDSFEILSTHADKDHYAEVSSRLQFSFTGITQNLINFGDIEKQRELAIMIKQLRKLTVSNGGLLDNINSYRNGESRFVAANLALEDVINDISNVIDNIIINSKTTFADNIASYFTNILKDIVVISIIIGLSIIVLAILVNHFVVERQINRRMIKLTSAVTDIANGDNDRTVDIAGTDEIGIIAKALETFKRNAKELTRSNTELEQFAYSASHDLKSPLRAIENLAQWTLEDAGDELQEDARSNLEQLLSRAQRLSQLQTDLLEYSRAGKVDSNIDELNIGHVVEKLADLLDPEHNFKISANHIPYTLYIHITPFRQILMNLINNAIKHHDKSTGEILISAQVYKTNLIVSVIDDGPGIEKIYQEKIFGLFEKLESRDSVEGSGLGLSLVKKMIEGRDGSIFIESDPSVKSGCTFTFDWPIVEVQAELPKTVGF